MGCVLQCIYLLYPSSKNSCVVSQVETCGFRYENKVATPTGKVDSKGHFVLCSRMLMVLVFSDSYFSHHLTSVVCRL